LQVLHYLRLALDVPKLLPWARTSPAHLLALRAAKRPDDLALAYRDERYSWAEVDRRASIYQQIFTDDGIGRGDVVALMMDNRPDYLFALLGLSKLAAVGALINTNLTGKALAHAITVAKAKKILAGSEHRAGIEDVFGQLEGLDVAHDFYVHQESGTASHGDTGAQLLNARLETSRPAASIDPSQRAGDVFCYIYTSGTTGLPKAAIIRNQRYLGAALTFGHLMHRCGPGDVIYVPLPLYHSNALMLGWGAALATGAGLAIRRKFSVSEFWDDIREYGATSFVYIGELCRYLLNSPEREGESDHRLRVAVGNGLRPDIWTAFQERFRVPLVREFYGSTEGNAPALNLAGKPGMIGRLGRGQAVVRCDPDSGEMLRNSAGFCERVGTGEIGLLVGRISAVTSFDGYVDRSATDSKVAHDLFVRGDRYFNTDDLVQLHEGRWLSFADRLGDTFRWKGENVSTTEVGELLCSAPGVLEANVYGVKVPGADGRAGMAALRVDDDFDLDSFATHVVDQLAPYQRPLFLRILASEMRVTGTLKHQKVAYLDEGYDPARVADPLYVLIADCYELLDAARFAQMSENSGG
jgi:acyl-CoA synthetase (AMP-forming)/AMP-acid ligase II